MRSAYSIFIIVPVPGSPAIFAVRRHAQKERIKNPKSKHRSSPVFFIPKLISAIRQATKRENPEAINLAPMFTRDGEVNL